MTKNALWVNESNFDAAYQLFLSRYLNASSLPVERWSNPYQSWQAAAAAIKEEASVATTLVAVAVSSQERLQQREDEVEIKTARSDYQIGQRFVRGRSSRQAIPSDLPDILDVADGEVMWSARIESIQDHPEVSLSEVDGETYWVDQTLEYEVQSFVASLPQLDLNRPSFARKSDAVDYGNELALQAKLPAGSRHPENMAYEVRPVTKTVKRKVAVARYPRWTVTFPSATLTISRKISQYAPLVISGWYFGVID